MGQDIIRHITRRKFMQGAAAATGVMVLPGSIFGRDGGQSANDKLNVAIIGAGGRGGAHVDGLMGENIVALVDVDDQRAAGSFKKVPGAADGVGPRRIVRLASSIHLQHFTLDNR